MPSRAHSAAADAARRAGVADERVLAAIEAVDRREHLPREYRRESGRDAPVPIGHGQTTSQPSLIALMLEALDLDPEDRVLEVGTGSGYQTAILARLVAEVVSVETEASLARAAAGRLRHLPNVEVHVGDGTLGWPERAPFDAITVGAAGPRVPRALLEQLAPGGCLVIPVERRGEHCWLERYRKADDGAMEGPERLLGVRFVPLVGEDGHPPRGS